MIVEDYRVTMTSLLRLLHVASKINWTNDHRDIVPDHNDGQHLSIMEIMEYQETIDNSLNGKLDNIIQQ